MFVCVFRLARACMCVFAWTCVCVCVCIASFCLSVCFFFPLCWMYIFFFFFFVFSFCSFVTILWVTEWECSVKILTLSARIKCVWITTNRRENSWIKGKSIQIPRQKKKNYMENRRNSSTWKRIKPLMNKYNSGYVGKNVKARANEYTRWHIYVCADACGWMSEQKR